MKSKVVRLDKSSLPAIYDTEAVWVRYQENIVGREGPVYMLCDHELRDYINLSPHQRVLYAVFTDKPRKDSFTIVPAKCPGAGYRWRPRMAHIKEHTNRIAGRQWQGSLYPQAALYLMAAYEQGYRYVHFEVAA